MIPFTEKHDELQEEARMYTAFMTGFKQFLAKEDVFDFEFYSKIEEMAAKIHGIPEDSLLRIRAEDPVFTE